MFDGKSVSFTLSNLKLYRRANSTIYPGYLAVFTQGRSQIAEVRGFPLPDPQHTYQRQYFSNQLAATYNRVGNTHKTIAQLQENGTVTWKTTPAIKTHTTRGTDLDGRILRMEFVYPYYYKMLIAHGKGVTRRFILESITKDILDPG
jgi:hypothetical protein